jgi:hypothetical protein
MELKIRTDTLKTHWANQGIAKKFKANKTFELPGDLMERKWMKRT